jgi:peptidoglycan L-alanyl-D-glutamate endopeptidase CwlK
MKYSLGPKSLAKLDGVHPDLVRVVKRAIAITRQDFMVLEGIRTPARQAELYAQGRTKPGPKVTWTMTSNHFRKADGYGYAVDLCPFPVDWNTASKFDDIADAMEKAAKAVGVSIRSGMDWDRDGKRREVRETDSPHFELAR